MEQIIFMHRNSYVAFVSAKYCKCWAKGGLISEKFSLWLQSPKKCAKSLSWALSTKREDVQYTFWHILFGDWIQLETNSEIKPPLVIHLNSSIYLARIYPINMLKTVDKPKRLVQKCTEVCWLHKEIESEYF